MRQVLGPGALGRPRGIGYRGRWEGGSGWGIHVNPWLIRVNVWQKPLQYCKVISLQLIKINAKKKKRICPQCRRPRFNSWVGKIPWRREWPLTPVSLLGESHGQRSLAGYSPWGCKELDMTDQLSHSHVSVVKLNTQTSRHGYISKRQ